MTRASIEEARRRLSSTPLLEGEADPNPIRQFRNWFEEVLQIDLYDPTGMTLATSSRQGRPSARTVLLKDFDEHGFVFYTNLESRKALELESNPHAALVFWWAEAGRQVRIEGVAEKLSAAEAEAYFRTRPRGSQLGAWASDQSRIAGDRGEMDRRFREAAGRFGDKEIPLPPFWGGYRVKPEAIEFWQLREDRLHDRLLYTKKKEGGWRMERLYP